MQCSLKKIEDFSKELQKEELLLVQFLISKEILLLDSLEEVQEQLDKTQEEVIEKEKQKVLELEIEREWN